MGPEDSGESPVRPPGGRTSDDERPTPVNGFFTGGRAPVESAAIYKDGDSILTESTSFPTHCRPMAADVQRDC